MTKGIYLIFILFANLFPTDNLVSQEYFASAGYNCALISYIDKTPTDLGIEGLPIISFIYSMVETKGNTQILSTLNKEIPEIKGRVKIQETQNNSTVHAKVEDNHSQIIKKISVGLIVAIILIMLGFIWVWYLYLQIKKKTESLDHKNQELQKSEAKFRIITENSTDVIYQLDSDFRLTYVSASDERLRGFRKEDIMGNSLFSILKPEGIELIMTANKKRMIDYSNGIEPTPLTYEVEEICIDGSWVWVEATASAHFDKDGKVSGYMGVSRDITERKRTEQLLKEKESQLKELISTKDKLFSIIAHDLRSPFNAILGFSELLMEDTKDFEAAESKTYLNFINSSAKSTLILLDNLLNWSKAQTGQIIFEPKKTNLSVIIKEIIDMSNSFSKLKNISLNFIQTENNEVYADLNMLKTILRNLISNAVKYTYPNGEINISSARNQKNTLIMVSDNGVGMSEVTRNKLFKVDTNIATRGTQNEKGSGLGLILCKEFVEKHGGEIWVESEVGKGSTFVFSLPVR